MSNEFVHYIFFPHSIMPLREHLETFGMESSGVHHHRNVDALTGHTAGSIGRVFTRKGCDGKDEDSDEE